MSADTSARWSQLLDELEMDIRRAQDVLAALPGDPGADLSAATPGDVGQWTPPADLGPLPESLRARAQAVVNLQQVVTQSLADAQGAARAHLRVTQTLRRRNAPQAVYLDTLG